MAFSKYELLAMGLVQSYQDIVQRLNLDSDQMLTQLIHDFAGIVDRQFVDAIKTASQPQKGENDAPRNIQTAH